MNEPPPLPPPLTPIEYASAQAPPRRAPVLSLPMMFIGLVVGAAISAAIWIGGWDSLSHGNAMAAVIIAVVAVKLVAGVVLLFFSPKPRGFGLGLVISIVLGVLIFFGNCTLHLNV